MSTDLLPAWIYRDGVRERCCTTWDNVVQERQNRLRVTRGLTLEKTVNELSILALQGCKAKVP